MKKIVASVGLVAIGVSGVQAGPVPSLSADSSKPWNISATLRGFYDDNINSAPDKLDLGDYKRDSFGFEVSPSVGLLLPLDQTTLSAEYVYSYKYYDNKPVGNTGHDDQSHTFNIGLDHAFSERYQIAVKDSFVIGQEPDLLRTGNAMTTFQRIPGDNIRNYGTINLDGKFTRTLGYQLGYANGYFNYDDDKINEGPTGEVMPSLSGLLDRMEHTVHLDGRWQIQPDTVGILGYQFREVDYIGNQAIGGFFPVGPENPQSDVRNSRSHYGYVGMDHSFRPDLSGSVRVGGEFTEYYNDPGNQTAVSPYILASLRWSYMPESFAEVGFTHDRNATDILGITGDKFTMDQESSVVYGTVTHRILPKLYGTVIAQFQDSEFQGGLFDRNTERFYSAGVTLEYRINQFLSTHAGYSYDRLESDLGDMRAFDRNRVYVGLTARY